MPDVRIQPGFGDPVQQSQQVFRRVLDAMSRPGSVHRVDDMAPAAPGLSPAATAVGLTLLDFETPLWLDDVAAAARGFFAFHCGAPVTAVASEAAIAIIGDVRGLGDLDRFAIGSDEHPETAATLIVEVDGLRGDGGVGLAGPGIRDRAELRVDGAPEQFWTQVAANRALFPRGVDLLLTCDQSLAALPRSVRLVGGA